MLRYNLNPSEMLRMMAAIKKSLPGAVQAGFSV